MAVGDKKRQRVRNITLSFVALGLGTIAIGYGLRDGIQYYRSPSEILAEPPHPRHEFRVGGLVEEGSVERQGERTIHFSLSDGAQKIDVIYSGILPDLFEENQGAIALGTYRDGLFHAKEVLAKHDEDYMPKEVADMLEKQGHLPKDYLPYKQ